MELYVPPTAQQDADEPEVRQLEVNYEPKEEDEEKFMLLYALNVQPSELGWDFKEDVELRRWVLARVMMQKQMEAEDMHRQRAMMMEQAAAARLAQSLTK